MTYTSGSAHRKHVYIRGKWQCFCGGETVSSRKYASDYRLETHVSPKGKVESIPVYQGKYFTFAEPAERISFLRKLLLIGCAVIFLLLLPMLLDNTRLGRTFYVVLPTVFSLAPLYLLLAGARRLGFSEDPFIREHRDKTDKRIRGAAVTLSVCLAVGCLGSLLHFVLNGFAADELLCVVCLFLGMAVSLVLLRYRKLARTIEAQQ